MSPAMSPAPRQAPALRAYLARVVRRPWPWILRYGLATVPAFLLAPLLLLPLASWFRLPLLLEALETRSLDLLLEVPMHRSQTAAQGPWLALAMLLVPVAWLVVRALAYGLEGGILATYAREEPPTARAFARACFRWFGSFLLLAALALVLIGTLSLLVGVLVVLARMLWRPLGTVVMIVGGLLIVAALVWFELARAAAVARDDRHVLRALRRAVRLVVQRPILLIALVGATLALRVGLALGARLVAGAIPVSWWLATLGVQQAIQVAIVGLNLVRKAGEVGLAIHLAPQASQEGTGG